MAKKLSFDAAKELTAQHSAVAMVALVSVYPVSGGAPIRLCSGYPGMKRFSVKPLRYGMEHRGDRYDYMAMRAVMPGSSMNSLPAASIETDNIDPAVVAAVRSSIYRATLDLKTVFSSRPDQVIESYQGLEVVDATWDDDIVTLAVGYPSLETTPLVRHRLTVAVSPCLRNMG